MKSSLFLVVGFSLSLASLRAADGEKKPEAVPSVPPVPSVAPGTQSLLQKYDKNGDGKLDDAERAAMQADRRKMLDEREKERLKKYDKNGDGKLDDAERAEARADFIKQRREEMARRRGPGAPSPAPAATDGKTPPPVPVPPAAPAPTK